MHFFHPLRIVEILILNCPGYHKIHGHVEDVVLHRNYCPLFMRFISEVIVLSNVNLCFTGDKAESTTFPGITEILRSAAPKSKQISRRQGYTSQQTEMCSHNQQGDTTVKPFLTADSFLQKKQKKVARKSFIKTV